ncbi:MAG: N-acetylglucosaminyldiphosphoundecaprenol N-acetyl-beta-D-mannosaminyltransferase [Cryomorphaceae bacterium]|jgi:N-acetylglucosaminyldiphosphoundecaprenol N-acetyl-beta-D-mannosaminyltransferase
MKKIELSRKSYTALNRHSLTSLISNTVESNAEQVCLASINMHALAVLRKDPLFSKYYEQTNYIYLDGMPIIWMLKLLGVQIGSDYRITVLDWHKDFFKLANRKHFTVAMLGGQKSVVNKASDRLRAQFDQVTFLPHHGYINYDEVPEFLINTQVDVLLVGMGMPKEEIWILRNASKLNVKVIIPVGGYFDYVAGETYTPPRWSGRIGLEWLFRLFSSPKRLTHRYFIEPWPVLLDFLKELKSNERT